MKKGQSQPQIENNALSADLIPWHKRKLFTSSIYEEAIKSAKFLDLPANHVGPAGLTKSDISDKLTALRECCSILEIHEHQDGHRRIHTANFCKLPAICPMDAHRLQSRRHLIFSPHIAAAIEQGLIPYVVTFTVTSRPTLRDQVEHLKKSIRAWKRKGQRRVSRKTGLITHGRGESRKVVSGFCAIEEKRGESGNWHAHAHALVFTEESFDYQVYDQEQLARLTREHGQAIPREELLKIAIDPGDFQGQQMAFSKATREWLECTGDSVDLHFAPLCKPDSPDPQAEAIKGAREVLKYVHKANYTNAEDVIDVLDQTSGFRFFDCWGEFRGLKKEADSYADNLETEKAKHGPRTAQYWTRHHPLYGYASATATQETLLDLDEIATALHKDALSKAALELAAYQRRRRTILDELRDTPDCAFFLDTAKRQFREKLSRIWTRYKMDRQIAAHEAAKHLPSPEPPDPQVDPAPPPEDTAEAA